MPRLRIALLSLAFAPALFLPLNAPAQAKNNNTGAALVGGLIAGAAIGAALSNSKDHTTNIYVAPPPPPRAQPFSPKPNVTCYPQRHACYNANGSYNGNWTWKIYAK